MLLNPEHQIFSIANEKQFNELALEVYHFQKNHCPVYQEYLTHLGKYDQPVNHYREIPFLPIELFKYRKVICGEPISFDCIFTSSGTTGSVPSKHYVKNIQLYEQAFLKGFQYFYGAPSDYVILALLPSYLEREGASLVYMAGKLIEQSQHSESGFYLRNFQRLKAVLQELEEKEQKTLLLGVSFALLDFAEKHPIPLKNTIIMETGGMKGRRKELTRPHLHQILQEAFQTSVIHSEYGMTELLSQAYSKGKGIFRSPPWMKVLIRETTDPFTWTAHQMTGGINIIDLANIHSCSFIATQDLGKTFPDGSFEVSGRFDNSDIRGCNLMMIQ